MRASLAHLGLPVDFHGLSVAIQGVGHVGYHIAAMLAAEGARLVAADIVPDRLERVVREFGATPVAPEKILTTECDILSPCAMGGVVDANLARKLRCRIIAGAANNVLDDPDEDAVVLGNQGILYAPSFIANAGGLIRLACVYLGMGDKEIDAKIDNIEATTAQVLRDAESMASTYAAAVSLVNRRIEVGSRSSKEQVHAG